MVPAWKISEPYPCAWDYLELSGTSPCFVAGVSPAHLSPPTQPLCGNVSAWPRAVKWLCGGGPCGSPSPPPWHISYSLELNAGKWAQESRWGSSWGTKRDPPQV